MAADTDEFHVWLCDRLKSLNLDEEVLGDYIAGILNSDDSLDEEKAQALADILEGMMETPDVTVSADIFMKWKEFEKEKTRERQEQEAKKQDALLAAVIEKKTESTKTGNKAALHKIDVEVKKHVIAHYGQQSDDDDVDSSSDEDCCQTKKSHPPGKDIGLFQNTNLSSVVEKEREKREKQKCENEEKKLRIKQDREKQKEKAELRKEKEKKRTQKGERRR